MDDDETPAVVIDADPSTANMDEAGPLTLTEGHASNAAKTYSVRLATEPTQTVTVTLTSADTGAVSIDDTDGDSGNGVQNTLTFTAMNWSTAQSVTARAADDDNATDESVALAHAAGTATTSEYTGVTASLAAAVDDDETRAVTLSASTLSVPENGSATYTVKLAAQPVGGDVTVTITGAGDGVTANPTTLTFTTTNWSAAQTVTVSAASDTNTANEVVTLTHTPTGADYGGGVGVAADLEATAADNDTPSLRVDPTMLTVAEGGSASYQVRLNTQPSAGVTVTVAGATAEATVDTDDDATGNQTTLTFSTTDWGADQEVKVSAAEDDDGTDETLTLSHTATGATEYAGLAVGAARPSVAVTVDDNDTRAIVIDTDPTTASVVDHGPLALNEKQTDPANAKTYSVRLATEPTATVTVTITSGDAGAVSIDDTDGDSTNGVQNALTFTTTTWDAAQSVTVRAVEDDDGGNETLDLTHAASGGDYDDLSATLGAQVADDDPLGLAFAATDLTTNGLDEGGSATYAVKLDTQPTGAVAVAISSDDADVTVDDTDGVTPGVQSSLAFDATTWNTAQTVTIRAGEDDDGAGETVTLTHDPSGADYDGVESADLEFTLNDDDPRGVTLSASTLSVPEAASATYTVKLDTQPVGGNATVTITGAAGGITASPTTLTFTRSNWSATRTVTVSAANDANTANEVATLTHTPTGADYGGVTPAALVATATDDDTPRLRGESDHADGGGGEQRHLPGAVEHAAERQRDGDGGRRDGRGDRGHGRRRDRRPEHADVHDDGLGRRPGGEGERRRGRRRDERDADAGPHGDGRDGVHRAGHWSAAGRDGEGGGRRHAGHPDRRRSVHDQRGRNRPAGAERAVHGPGELEELHGAAGDGADHGGDGGGRERRPGGVGGHGHDAADADAGVHDDELGHGADRDGDGGRGRRRLGREGDD